MSHCRGTKESHNAPEPQVANRVNANDKFPGAKSISSSSCVWNIYLENRSSHRLHTWHSCILNGPRKRIVKFGAIWTHDMFNNNKLWIKRRRAHHSSEGWDSSMLITTTAHSQQPQRQLILQVRALLAELSFTPLWLNRWAAAVAQIQGSVDWVLQSVFNCSFTAG